ncbi:lipopolysaccharide biosynthesis protein [Micromonospora humidisoli]|uniref:lipopolysaccharide biosynthesis protein n=1 Tax=Micromonospora sp. AKA109 TaxID=2733865 RepID=UPI002490E597|nr:polysaccharide biosynthesis C-terminal domain-containing protein [Micromonospora sp. AKA109]
MRAAGRLVTATAANLLVPVSGLIVSPFLSRELGPEGRGLFAALTLPIVVCGWLGTYGLQDALAFHVRQRRLSRRDAARVSMLAAVPLGLVAVLLLGVLGLFVFDRTAGERQQFMLLTLLAPVHLLTNLVIGALTGASDVGGVNLMKAVPAVLRTVLMVIACVAFDLSPFWSALLALTSTATGVLFGLPRLRRRAGPASCVETENGTAPVVPPGPARRAGAVDRPGPIPVRSLVRYALVCLPGVLAATSSARLDQVVGLPLLGARELGFYAVAVSVAELPTVVATAARTILMGGADAEGVTSVLWVARMALPAAAFGCAVLAAGAGLLVPRFFGVAFAPAVLPTVILCAATVVYTCVQVFSALLLAHGEPARSSAALVAGSLTGVLLLVVLAPSGAVGAALASLVGYVVAAGAAARSVRRLVVVPSLRAVTVPYVADLRLLCARLGWTRREPRHSPTEAQDTVGSRVPDSGRSEW